MPGSVPWLEAALAPPDLLHKGLRVLGLENARLRLLERVRPRVPVEAEEAEAPEVLGTRTSLPKKLCADMRRQPLLADE